PPLSSLFPYTTLFRSARIPPAAASRRRRLESDDQNDERRLRHRHFPLRPERPRRHGHRPASRAGVSPQESAARRQLGHDVPARRDRKSTRLNSSHVST